ncbi:hypothetical protein [Rhodococcus sp. NPDC058521]|uniref:hypothetical protein n=1 Tax=Rhodococcus sp. NPDC058521 TaxID=3346536 RepID=UPI003668B255
MTHHPFPAQSNRSAPVGATRRHDYAKRPFIPVQGGFVPSGLWLSAIGIVLSTTGLSIAAVAVTGSLMLGGLIMLLTLGSVSLAAVMI